MSRFDIYYPRIQQYAPGCPEPTADIALIHAAQTFCERTRTWRHADNLTLKKGQPCLCVPCDADIFEIETVAFNGQMLDVVPYADALEAGADWTQEGSPYVATQASMDSILLLPPGAGTLSVSLFLRPSNGAKSLPGFLATHYLNDICDGALAEVLMIPDQPFANPNLAQVFDLHFRDRLDHLFDRNVRGQQRAPARTKPNWL